MTDINNTGAMTPEQIIDITKIAEKSLEEVEAVLGQADEINRHQGYPRVEGFAEKAIFQRGKYEVIFAHGVANRITIHSVPDFTTNIYALLAIGLKAAKPAFFNPSVVIRWEKTQGFDEISFFTDFILIDTAKKEFAKRWVLANSKITMHLKSQ